MAKWDGKLENMTDICLQCDYLQAYLAGKVDVKTARENCALRCKQHDNQRKGIYKFDVVYSLYVATEKVEKPKFKGKGKVSKAEERYGKAVRELHKEGKSISDISRLLNISRPTIYKLLK
ncbi:MAG: helix-turn-helix domain-containing protein [[Eubacterium] saphenum]|nr:helix-turn-helix domain-containing protein [[Eubacterium] saphenum]